MNYENLFFAHDDMTRPLRFSDTKKKGRKNRSMSLGERDCKKGVSSLASKISSIHS